MGELPVVRVGDAHARGAVKEEVQAELPPAEEEHWVGVSRARARARAKARTRARGRAGVRARG